MQLLSFQFDRPISTRADNCHDASHGCPYQKIHHPWHLPVQSTIVHIAELTPALCWNVTALREYPPSAKSHAYPYRVAVQPAKLHGLKQLK